MRDLNRYAAILDYRAVRNYRSVRTGRSVCNLRTYASDTEAFSQSNRRLSAYGTQRTLIPTVGMSAFRSEAHPLICDLMSASDPYRTSPGSRTPLK